MLIYTCYMCNNHIRNAELQSSHHIYLAPITIFQLMTILTIRFQNQPPLMYQVFFKLYPTSFTHLSSKITCTYVEISFVATFGTLLVFTGLTFASSTHMINVIIRNYQIITHFNLLIKYSKIYFAHKFTPWFAYDSISLGNLDHMVQHCPMGFAL